MAMGPIKLELFLFRERNKKDQIRSHTTLLYFMQALVQANILWLRYHPESPSLYASEVIYQIEEDGEEWQDIPTTIEKGFGDCEDLACWRVAELRHAGINAMPYIKWKIVGNDESIRYHALVKWPDGKIEDPSLALGMHGAPMLRKPIFVDP